MYRERAKKKIGLADLPKEVRVSVINIMNTNKIDDVEEGLVKMAMLSGENDVAYWNAVEKEAERRYRSRHFKELNQTTATLKKIADIRAQAEYNKGWAECFKKYSVPFPCTVCGGMITITPNSEIHRAIIGFLQEKHWAHGECLKG